MKILITGKGSSGSWQIRGVQLGEAIGATVKANASTADMKAHDVIVLVKRPTSELLRSINDCGRPLVWDAVDAWPQPAGNLWGRAAALRWMENACRDIRPSAIVGATKGMAGDFSFVSNLPCTWIPHHVRPGIVINPIREKVLTVGYEGGSNYVASSRHLIEKACKSIGAQFSCASGVDALSKFDIVLATRDYTGYPARFWKSNVKLTNAHGSGTPVIINGEQGQLDVVCGGEELCNSGYLADSLRALVPRDKRAAVSRKFIEHSQSYSLSKVSEGYLSWISALKF